MELFPLKKALQVFGRGPDFLSENGIAESKLPAFARSLADGRPLKSWSLRELPAVGELVGFMSKPKRPLAVSVFVTKGGVLKSTLTLNLARAAALHGIRTCVVGLDMQGDISTALASDELLDEDASFGSAVAKMDALRGLADVFHGDARLDEVILESDIPTLSYVPETPELVALDQSLIHRNRREYWLQENVIAPLKERFDLIVMDCSPNWNRLITNSLVACDALISPLECKINNFRNFKVFQALIGEFKYEMRAEFKQVFVPTRLSPSRKLSREIFDWYRDNLPACTSVPVRESLQGEEATAMRVSLLEYAPTTAAAEEMRALLSEVWTSINSTGKSRTSSKPVARVADLTV